MNVKNKNIPDWNLIQITSLISLSVFFNYFLWSINSIDTFLYLNFFILLILILYFLINKNFKKYNVVRVFFLTLLILSLGSATIDWDARSVWIFHAKRIFFDNNLYSGFDNYMPELMNAYPILPASLSATLAKIIGHWNEIFPKTTNIFILLPALLLQCSLLKNYKLVSLWLMFILLFSGRILINGLMDGLVAMYFVSFSMVVFILFFEKNINFKKSKNSRLFFITSGICLGIILSLLKNEGFVLILLIFITTIFLKVLEKIKFKFEDIIFWIIIFTPIIIWKFLTLYNGIQPRIMGFGFENAMYSQSLFERFFIRLSVMQNYKLIFSNLLINEKLIISILIFIYCFVKMFKKNKLLFIFIISNVISYYILLYFIYLSTPHDLAWHLNSSHRVLITIVLALTFFSIYIFQKRRNFI
tara:strand:+ start:7058 stop:8305 length:1248 start_codon:yes stop_codon:yes gene_type:complete